MKTSSRLAVTGVVAALAIAAVAASSQIEPDEFAPPTDDGFVIDDFHRAVEVRPDGRLEVVESIDVTFQQPRRGIFRDLETSGPVGPVTYDVHGVDRGSADQPWNWILEDPDASVLRLRIGDADVELDPGPQHYRLSYGMEGLLFRPQDRPGTVQIRIDVPGDQWPTTVAATTLVVDLPAEPTRVACVQGARGEIGACPEVQITGTRVEQSVPALEPRETATVAIDVPASAFTADFPVFDAEELTTSGVEEEQPPPIPAIPAALLLLVLVAAPALVLELLRARLVYRDRVTDPALHDRVAPTAALEPPDNARPLELAAVLHRSVDDELVLATLLDLELRGAVQTETTGIGEDEQRITVTPAPTGTRLRGEPPRPWEAAFLGALFGSRGRIVFDGTYDEETSERTTAASKMLSTHGSWLLSKESPLTHTAAGWLRGGAFAAWILLCLVLGAVIGVVGTVVLDLSPFVPFVVWSCLAVSWPVLSFLWRPQRLPLTSEGRDVIARTTAFRTFLEQVHGDRLEFAAGRNQYDQHHPALELLPYAMALGLAESWYLRFEPVLAELAQQGAVPSAGAYPWWAYGAGFAAVQTSYTGTTTSPASAGGGGSFGGGGAGSGGGGGGGGSW